MLSLVLFFLLISSGSVYATVRYGRRYEETVPLTFFCGVEILFLFGLFDGLRPGVWVVCILAAVLYTLSGLRVWRRGNWREVCGNLFTPAFFIFLILLVVYAFSVSGRAACYNDDFSFWASSVKKMWFGGKFACAIEKNLVFVEYPPGMQLIQYVLQFLKGEFTDWRLYLADAAYVFALFLPFLKGMRFRPLPLLPLAAALVFSAGTIIYPGCWDTLQVDFALGVTFAYGLAMLFSLEEGQGVRPFALANVVMAANMLVLIKSAGMLLAVILLVILLISVGFLRPEAPSVRTPLKGRKLYSLIPEGRRWICVCAYVAAVLVPVVTNRLWKLKYSLYVDTQAPVFDTGNYDFSEFIQILLSKTDGGYRGGIKSSFFRFLTVEKLNIGWISLTNIQFVLLLAAVFLGICYIYRKTGSKRVHACTVGVTFGFELVYWLGLLCSYMYTFSQVEGVALASVQRYLNIYHTGVLLCAVFLILKGWSLLPWNPLLFSAVLVFTLSFTSAWDIQRLLTRDYAEASVRANQAAQDLADRLPPEEDAGLLLVYKRSLPHIPVNRMRYLAYEGYNLPWECIYGSQPQEGEGGYTHIYTAEEFRQHVYDLGTDYIALEHLDEDFISTYAELFNAPLADGQIYRVPEESGLFELISPLPEN